MLAEHGEAVHSEFVDKVEDFWYGFSNFFFQLCDDFEDVIIAEDSFHSDDYFPDDEKDVFFYFCVDSLEEFCILDSNGLEAVYDNIE
jgi:hypothetical protein